MNYLGIDTSGKQLTVLLRFGGKDYSYIDPDCGVKHSAELVPRVKDLLESAGARLADMDFFACVVGAGSFTGVRIGGSTVRAFAFAVNKPYLRITSFDALAYDVKEKNVLCVIDAGHGSYYVQEYRDKKPAGEARFVGSEEYGRLCSLYPAASADDVPHRKFACDTAAGLKAAVGAKAGEITFDEGALTPLYIRRSQAEEGR